MVIFEVIDVLFLAVGAFITTIELHQPVRRSDAVAFGTVSSYNNIIHIVLKQTINVREYVSLNASTRCPLS
jgi:hypothetical protein